jgi:hypothetical protein
MSKSLPVRAAALRTGELASALTVRLTDADRAFLDRYAQEHGCTAGEIMRVALADYCSQHKASKQSRRLARV